MSYEVFRNTVYADLANHFSPDQLNTILRAMDITAADYEIHHKCYDLTLCDGVPPLVKDYLASCMIRKMGMETVQLYQRRLTTFFKNVCKPFDKVTANDIRVYILRYDAEHKVCPETLNHILSCISGFYEWCVQEDYLVKNPCKKVEKIKEPKKEREGITEFELEQIRSACKNNRDRAIVDLLVSSGVRVSECIAIRLSDIDWNERSIKIWHGKGDKERTVFFSSATHHSLETYLASRTDHSDSLFVSSREPHNPVTKSTIQKMIRNLANDANIQHKLSPHILRHTFATILLGNGMPLEQVQSLLGHVNPATTLIYAKVNKKDIQRNHQKFSA